MVNLVFRFVMDVSWDIPIYYFTAFGALLQEFFAALERIGDLYKFG